MHTKKGVFAGLLLATAIGCTPTAGDGVAVDEASDVAFGESERVDFDAIDGPPDSENDLVEVMKRCTGYHFGEAGFPEDQERAFPWCLEGAIAGHSLAQSIVGGQYFSGDGVDQSYPDALYWLTLAANQDNSRAALSLFFMYYMGVGVAEPDYDTAFMFLTQAADLGMEPAKEILRIPEGDPLVGERTAAETQAMLAEKGMAKTAPMYPRKAHFAGIEGYAIVSYCVDKDGRTSNLRVVDSKPAGIFDEVSLAAARNFRYAPETIDGEPVVRHGVTNKFTFSLDKKRHEPEGAAEKKAALTENVKHCAGHYHGKEGYTRDYELALKWCSEAATEGHPLGRSLLGGLYYYGNAVEQNYEYAHYWYTLAANHDMPVAQYTLAYMYLNGLGVEADKDQWMMYLVRAAKGGDKSAKEALGITAMKTMPPSLPEEEIQQRLQAQRSVIVPPLYPPGIQSAGIEGYATVQFCVDQEGQVHDVHIVESSPPGVFDAVSIHAGKQIRYAPPMVDGEPTSWHGMQTKFTFKLEKSGDSEE